MVLPPLLAEIRTSHIWGLPPCVTVGGHRIDALLLFIVGLTVAVFVGTQAVFVASLIKWRHRPGVAAHHTHGHAGAEFVWTAIPAAIFLGLFLYSDRLWFQLRTPPPDGAALDVEIVGEQFDWLVRYPGADGKLGRADAAWETPANHIGLDASDPLGKDDFVLRNELVVPLGRPVHLHLRSRDVIHSVYLPEFRLYQDLVPGRTINWVSFTADRAGQFSLACSQLCGSGHGTMQGRVRVVPAAEFDRWYQDEEKAKGGTP